MPRLGALALLSTILYAADGGVAQGAIAVVAVLVYICGFAIGLGAGFCLNVLESSYHLCISCVGYTV